MAEHDGAIIDLRRHACAIEFRQSSRDHSFGKQPGRIDRGVPMVSSVQYTWMLAVAFLAGLVLAPMIDTVLP
ncbi:hypothetical protein [Methylobacterium haplocladii]|uniref:Uncharacterized protein n=1 Tax=Methylobacterium haplocladii TaxID=1176176 RepID=A0A512ING5_9HYPH|nr:hypothetical protein [Methylobacterium haplocladii]GEO99178.1 hypothetical protein MHA02_15660 [Methylobacterium haplocladii]GLS58498.1 hypothetical protein GCM10007887_11610 [Methylobacterium haplocladii]